MLEEYTGQTNFIFELTLGNLIPRQMAGESIPLLDPDTQEIVMFIGQVNVYDSCDGEEGVNESWNNRLLLESADNEGTYYLTVCVDSEFLNSEDTVYPVTVDPTLSAYPSGLETVLVAENNPTCNYVTNQIFFAGEDNSGEYLTYVQATRLDLLAYINPNNITSATFRAYCRSSAGASSLSMRAYDTSRQWTPSTLTYNNKPQLASNWTSSLVEVNSIGRYYSFDITYLAKKWLSYSLGESGGWSYKFGFALKGEDNGTLSRKGFNSINHTENKPTLTITYTQDQTLEDGIYYIKNVNSQKYMYASSSDVMQVSYQGGEWQQFRVTHAGNGYYTLTSVFHSTKSMTLENITNYNIGMAVTNSSDTSQQFRIVKNNDSVGSYRLFNRWNAWSYGADVYQQSDEELYNVMASPYTGSNSQKWVFEKATLLGAAKPYQAHTCPQISGHSTHNCYWYAVGMPDGLLTLPFDAEAAWNVEKMFEVMKGKFEENYPGRTCRRLKGKDDLINSATEYKVALRTYCDSTGRDYDYHFVMQLNTGEWAHMPGLWSPSQNLGFVNPDNLNDTRIWSNYNSPVLYIAFTL